METVDVGEALSVRETDTVTDVEDEEEGEELTESVVEPVRDTLDVRDTLLVTQLVAEIEDVKQRVVVCDELEETLLVRVTVTDTEFEALIVEDKHCVCVAAGELLVLEQGDIEGLLDGDEVLVELNETVLLVEEERDTEMQPEELLV